MPEIVQLEQLLAISKNGTISKAAEELHLSQPALSRSMQRLEEELGVTLFDRQKNKIEFNPNGELAVEYAEKIMSQTHDMTERIRAFDRSRHTIAVGSCAPAPLWDISPMLSSLYPELTISSEMRECDKLTQGLQDGTFQIIIMPFPMNEDEFHCVKCGEEQLFFSLPPGHALSGAKQLRFKDLDGETMLLHSQIGFWHKIHVEKMPSARFLLQNERFAFDELVKASALPSFTSDIVLEREGKPQNRVIIPISDEEAHAVYYCVCRAENKKRLAGFFKRITTR